MKQNLERSRPKEGFLSSTRNIFGVCVPIMFMPNTMTLKRKRQASGATCNLKLRNSKNWTRGSLSPNRLSEKMILLLQMGLGTTKNGSLNMICNFPRHYQRKKSLPLLLSDCPNQWVLENPFAGISGWVWPG